MAERALEIFQRLQTDEAIRGLINECEDAHFDCKEWRGTEEDKQKMLAKAICGLTNAEGGVLVVGMKAESRSKDEPDVVTAEAPVPDTALVKSRILSLVGNIVEPGIVGLQAEEISELPGAKSGFVVIYIPASEGAPRRSRKDWKFYLRIGSGTFPMEYFQIEQMFGQRHHPKLELTLEPPTFGRVPSNSVINRIFRVGVANTGRGIARFPSIRFKKSGGFQFPLAEFHGSHNNGLPYKPSWGDWINFRGGVDEVIYPGETLAITQLWQAGENQGRVGPLNIGGQWISNDPNRTRWTFKPIKFSYELYCEGLGVQGVDLDIPAIEEIQ